MTSSRRFTRGKDTVKASVVKEPVAPLRALGSHIFAGGFSIGVEQHFELLGHLERTNYGVKQWQHFRPNVPVFMNKTGAWTEASTYAGKVDFLYANPPCAPWSTTTVGYRRQTESPLLEWTRDVFVLARAVQAPVVAIESVRGAVRNGAEYYRGLASEFGFKSLSWIFVNPYDCGLPQWRPRVFVVLSDAGAFVPQWSPSPPPDVVDVIAGVPDDEENKPVSSRSIYTGAKIPATEIMKTIPAIAQGVLMNQVSVERLREYSDVVADRVDKMFPMHMLRRLVTGEPCPVVYALARYVHPIEDRLLTLRELMRVQGYPDDYHFGMDQALALRMLGKTVCPPVGAWLAREVAAHLRGERDVRYVTEATFFCCSDAPRKPGTMRIDDFVDLT